MLKNFRHIFFALVQTLSVTMFYSQNDSIQNKPSNNLPISYPKGNPKLNDSLSTDKITDEFHFKKDSSLTKDQLNKSIPNSDSLKKQSRNEFKKVVNNNKKVSITGVINNRYDYGAIPYYMANQSFPANLFKSNGTVKARFVKIPVIGDYFYSNPNYISGLNNYYTIKFDVDEFQKILNQQNLYRTKALKTGLDSLSQLNIKLRQQLALIEAQKIKPLQTNAPSIPQFDPKVKIPDSLSNIKKPDLPNDKLTKLLPSDSLSAIYSSIDTSALGISRIAKELNKNEKLIRDLKENIQLLEDPRSAMEHSGRLPQKPVFNVLSGIRKLEIGMCYPSYSTFMINQIAMKGINLKYELSKSFINASVGKTVYNYSVQPTTSSILNQLQSLSSMFDWNSNPNAKKIAALKLGLGKESKNYIGVGGLFGQGTMSPNSPTIKKNYVFEIDGRVMYKFISFEAAVAKSFLYDSNKSLNSEIPSSSINTNDNKSIQGKMYGTIPKIKTKFSLSARQIDPFYKSFGVGFMRADIRRLEGKIEQPIGSLIKIGLNYRHDQDNLKKLYSVYTNLNTYTYYGKIKLFRKRVDITLNYTTIQQSVNNKSINENKVINSNIRTIICSYTPRFKKLISTNTCIYSIYDLNDGVQRNSLENISLNSFNAYKKLQINILNAYNRSTITDSLNFTNALNSTLEIGYNFTEKVRVIGGAKQAYIIPLKMSQYGYSASISLALHKLFNIELKLEKLVIGDFINTLNYKNIHDYPYYGYVNLVSKF